MNPTFHLFCRISPASPPACRPLSLPVLLPASAVHLRPPSCAPPVCIRGSGVCSSAARFASLLRVLLCVSALRSGPARFPAACSALYPARPAQLAGLPVSSSPSRRASCSSTVITRSVRAAIVRSSL